MSDDPTPGQDPLHPKVTLREVVTALADAIDWRGDQAAWETVQRWLAENPDPDPQGDDRDQGDDQGAAELAPLEPPPPIY